MGEKNLAFKGQEGQATVTQPPLHSNPLKFWNLIMILANMRHIFEVVWYGIKWENRQSIDLIWASWPLNYGVVSRKCPFIPDRLFHV